MKQAKSLILMQLSFSFCLSCGLISALHANEEQTETDLPSLEFLEFLEFLGQFEAKNGLTL